MSKISIRVLVRYLYLWVVLFLFTTELPLLAGLTSRRLAALIAIISLFIKSKQVKQVWKYLDSRRVRSFFTLIFLVALISVVHYLSRDYSNPLATYSEPWFFLYIILYVLVFSLFCAVEFKSLKEFVLVIVGVYLFQTLVVMGGVINPAFRTYIYESFNNIGGDDRFSKTVEEGTRLMGINLAGATGSINMSTAALSLVILKLTNKIQTLWFWILYAIIMLGTVFVGRTGILVEMGLLLPLVLFAKDKIKTLTQISVFIILLVGVLMFVLSTLDPVISDFLWEWMTESFRASNRAEVNEGVLKGGLPPFTIDFIFGTGMDTGYSANGVVYDTDSGLIRTYMAYGIVGFVFYYLAMFKLLMSPKLKAVSRDILLFFYVCVAFAFLIEYKEPFMMKYIFPWSIVTCKLLYLKDSNAKRQLIFN